MFDGELYASPRSGSYQTGLLRRILREVALARGVFRRSP